MKASVRNYRGFFVIEAGTAKDAKKIRKVLRDITN
jgi:hypothetical protein